MKPEPSATQPNTEDAQKSSSDEAIIKDGTRVGIILTAVPVIVLVLMALGVQNGDFRFTEMVLYNNTGGEITTYGAGGPLVIQKNSWRRRPHPLSTDSWSKRYLEFQLQVQHIQPRWATVLPCKQERIGI